LSNFNNFWYIYLRHNWPLNGSLVYYLTQHLLLHYLGKSEQTKYALNQPKKLYKIIFFSDMWPPTANQLQGLTVVQQHVY